jgi:acetylornithine deacetylase/succinyl-diaminopimelate desuccinylase-like protein
MNAIELLQALIRLNTTNPPGNELLAADYLAELLGRAGYETTVLESAPGRGNVVARYHGDGSRRPLLLYNHLDVVSVEASQWTHDPFGGESDGGFIWGRGALDMKNVVTQQTMVMLRLAAERPQLRRDVIFAGCADEEVGGKYGLKWLVEQHPGLVEAEMGLSESGALPIYLGDQTVYVIQVGEKGNCRLQLTATAAPGHGASPNYNDYAIRYLSLALERLTRQQLPTHLTATLANTLAQLAPILGVSPANLTQPQQLDALLEQMPPSSLRTMLRSTTRNSAAPTMLSGGTQVNVVPSQVSAILDGRILPGFGCADLIAEVRAAIGDDLPVTITHLPEHDSIPLEAPSSGPMWEALVRNLLCRDPGAIVVPILLAGGTDAKHLAPLAVQTYGYSPMHFPPDFDWRNLVHGHDERIPISALPWGIDVLYDTVIELCS